MRNDQLRRCFFDYSAQGGDDSKIKASALRDNLKVKPKLAGGSNKFIGDLIVGTLTPEGDDQIIDRRKVTCLLVQFTR